MNIEIYLRNYKSKVSGFYAKTVQIKEDLQSHQSALQEHIASFGNRNILSKAFHFFPYALRKSSMENRVEELSRKLSQFPRGENNALRVLVLESARELMLNGDNADDVLRLEQEHRILSTLFSLTDKAAESGKRALNEVQRAIKSLNDAEVLEIMDAGTKSKFISSVSTIQSFSATDETAQVSQALREFQQDINEKQSRWSEIKHDTLIETVDFVMDMMIDSGLTDTLGSLFSLISLSETKGKLSRLYVELEPIVNGVIAEREREGSRLSNHENEMLALKSAERTKIIPLLHSHGVEVTNEFVNSITELYAPSEKIVKVTK
jgi:hypothetical protein